METDSLIDTIEMTMRDHGNLDAFNLAHKLVLSIYRATRDFPRHELCGVTGQMRRGAVSVATNIVEGYGRRSDAERFRFLDIAFGSVREIGYYIELSRDLGYLENDGERELSLLQSRAAAALAGLIKTRDRR